jgi:ATP-dependent protease ClpP protease subunit
MPDLDRMDALLAHWALLTAATRAGRPDRFGDPAGCRISMSGQRAEVVLYGAIDDWEVSASEVAAQLAGIDAAAMDVRINSTGGFAWDGIAIYTSLVRHRASVDTYVDGIAASAASIIVQAGDRRIITEPGQMMIHNARGIVAGAAPDMREAADVLDQISQAAAGVYAARSGKPVAGWSAAMDATTWYTSAQAVDVGLADEVAAAHTGSGSPSNAATSRALRVRHRHRARTMMAQKG